MALPFCFGCEAGRIGEYLFISSDINKLIIQIGLKCPFFRELMFQKAPLISTYYISSPLHMDIYTGIPPLPDQKNVRCITNVVLRSNTVLQL